MGLRWSWNVDGTEQSPRHTNFRSHRLNDPMVRVDSDLAGHPQAFDVQRNWNIIASNSRTVHASGGREISHTNTGEFARLQHAVISVHDPR